jgi:uncharacterized protein (DUF488 family)
MYYRRKILLSLLQVFGGRLSKLDFQKYLFLLNSNKTDTFFDFIPYKYGCYSFLANQDMGTLSKYNLVEEKEKQWIIKSKIDYLNKLKTGDKLLLTDLYRKYNSIKGKELIKYIYENYPYYAINSTIARQILTRAKYSSVLSSKPAKQGYALYSIGYEGKTIEHFTNELVKENIQVLCDIRKNALSMKYGFSKKQLKFIVENVGVKYIHIPELGIESNKRQNLNSSRDYEKLFRYYERNTLPKKSEELEELNKILISNKRIALMCFEADHKCCHRSRTINALVELQRKPLAVQHL